MIYKIHCDGGSRSNPGPAAAAFVVYGEKNEILFQEGKFLGVATNNVAEYMGVVLALEWLAGQTGYANPLNFYLDSQLIVNQLNGVFRIKEKTLAGLATRVKNLESKINSKVVFNHVLREKNKDADSLVNQTLDSQGLSS